MAKRKNHKKRKLPPLLLEVPIGTTTDESLQVVDTLWRFIAAISKFTPAQKKEMDAWILEAWGEVVLRTDNLEKMMSVVQNTINAYDLMDRLMG